jgi:hypothetical protein
MGHVGEYIAAQVFDIHLEHSASNKALDGFFASGPLAGRSVNVKWTAQHEGLLDMGQDSHPDYYLVLAGPRSSAGPSRGVTRPWTIHYVFLLEADALVAELWERGTRIGVATSVRSHQWAAGELYPESRNPTLVLTTDQRAWLELFG